MNSNIMINSESFQEQIEKFDAKTKEIQEVLETMSRTMKEIDGTNETWKSKVGERVHNDFVDVEKNFEKINAEFSVYSLFLKDVLEDYKMEEEKEEKSIEDGKNYLDINE